MTANNILHVLKGFDYWVIFDIWAVAFLIYQLLLLAKGTRAWQIIGGVIVFFLALIVSGWLHLYTLNWLLIKVVPLGPVALVILFYPELRHALEEFGRLGFWGHSFGLVAREEISDMIREVIRAVGTMSVKRIGALIVFERETGLDDISATGTPIEAEVTSALLNTIFYHGTPLHDGAVVIRGKTLVAAGCTLPLTDSPKVDAAVHTRHKAAIGMSEASDAVVVIVSEETGTVSLACEGKLIRGLKEEVLEDRLYKLLQRETTRRFTPIYTLSRTVGDAITKVRADRE